MERYGGYSPTPNSYLNTNYGSRETNWYEPLTHHIGHQLIGNGAPQVSLETLRELKDWQETQ